MAFLVINNFPRAPNIDRFAQTTYGNASLNWVPTFPLRWPVEPFKAFVNANKGVAIVPNGTNEIPFKPLPGGSGGGGGGPVGYPIDSG